MTDDVTFTGGVGSIMRLGFPVAPVPFQLRVDQVSSLTSDSVARAVRAAVEELCVVFL